MFVGLDATLVARDAALSGPDGRVASVSPSDLRHMATDADGMGLLADNVLEIVVEAANLAPEVPNSGDRRTIWSSETGRNLVIEAFNIAMKHPKASAFGFAATGAAVTTLGPVGSVAALGGLSLTAANFLLKHREWIESRLGDSPTWRALFLDLTDWLKDNTPFNGVN